MRKVLVIKKIFVVLWLYNVMYIGKKQEGIQD